MPVVDKATMASTRAGVFFGGDAAFGPKNIIWAVAHGHDAAISIDKYCRGEDMTKRPPPHAKLISQKMGIHEWSYDNAITPEKRHKVPLKDKVIALANIRVEVELGFDPKLAYAETQRCLNCDVQTVFNDNLCIECDACVDICPMDCITFTANGEEAELRPRLTAPALNLTQDLYVSAPLKTARIMAKDEDVCLHCGLCAERCPTGAWDMQKFLLTDGPRRRDPAPGAGAEARRRTGAAGGGLGDERRPGSLRSPPSERPTGSGFADARAAERSTRSLAAGHGRLRRSRLKAAPRAPR